MVFNSYTFLIFFGVVLLLHRLCRNWTGQKVLLLVASYVFYAAWNPPFVLLIWISTLVDWYAAQAMGRTTRRSRRRTYLLLSLSTNLGLLGFFKYGEFLLRNFQAAAGSFGIAYEPPAFDIVLPVGISFYTFQTLSKYGEFLLRNFQAAAGSFGIAYEPPAFDIVLPVGISFYTFQTLSYTIDVYRRKIEPWHSFVDFALFVTFFPQLVAGPIVRATYFLPQLLEPLRVTRDKLGWGFTLLTIGLFEKVVLADAILAPRADAVYDAAMQAGFMGAWIGTLAFSGQIFFDFAGYSTAAIGVGLCLGFTLPVNFRCPYAAIGFSDFWKRWHISLSGWLRDYLYIPLGGNRSGPRRTYINLMVTMLLGGLWHGAAWHFVLWGGLHGLYLAGERFARGVWGGARWLESQVSRVGLALGTYLLVCFTWVFFRAQTFQDAISLIRAMLDPSTDGLIVGPNGALLVAGVTLCVLAGQWVLRETSLEHVTRRLPWWARAVVLAGLLLSIALAPGRRSCFHLLPILKITSPEAAGGGRGPSRSRSRSCS